MCLDCKLWRIRLLYINLYVPSFFIRIFYPSRAPSNDLGWPTGRRVRHYCESVSRICVNNRIGRKNWCLTNGNIHWEKLGRVLAEERWSLTGEGRTGPSCLLAVKQDKTFLFLRIFLWGLKYKGPFKKIEAALGAPSYFRLVPFTVARHIRRATGNKYYTTTHSSSI